MDVKQYPQAKTSLTPVLTEHEREAASAAKIGREEATPAIKTEPAPALSLAGNKTEPAPTPSLFGNNDGIMDLTGDGDEALFDPHEGMENQEPRFIYCSLGPWLIRR
jgi:hypothetical protein